MAEPFTRYPATWMAYGMLAFMAFIPGTLGPAMPFLRSELSLSYTLGGILVSSLAVGMILAGLSGERLSGRFGRKIALWGGSACSASGVLLLASSKMEWQAILAYLMMGVGGGISLVMIQAMLSDLHGERRVVALMESNVGASLSSFLAPLIVGGAVRLGFGWRSALILGIIYLALLAVRFFRLPLPESQSNQPIGTLIVHKRLPRSYWAYWLVVVLVVAGEWCFYVWGAEFLTGAAGMTKASAATSVSVFMLAILIGRVLGSRLSRSLPGWKLLLGALGVSLAGFPIFWLAECLPLVLGGFFLCGLGIANTYPLAMANAVSQAPGQADLASARVSLGVGMAALVAPLTLGWLADQAGIQSAYGIVPVFLAAGAGLTYLVNRSGPRMHSAIE